ncbi:hypothetical protein RMATCC62417_06280 [Rhizopus microsporus]|nr:hypothetical protein RMATCC62417_06280 [Rhizopus microsporus]CEI92504.1 hypothetical protein RMCBS344292_06760 [Rhizopus microsporus]
MRSDEFDREKLRKIIAKKLGGMKLAPNVELLIYLDFLCFMEDLAKSAEATSLKKNHSAVNRSDIMEALENVLKKYRG